MVSATLPAWRAGADGDTHQHIATSASQRRALCGKAIRAVMFDRPDWERCSDCERLEPYDRRCRERLADWRAATRLMNAAIDRFGLDDPRVIEYVRNHNRFQSQYEEALAGYERVRFGGLPSPS